MAQTDIILVIAAALVLLFFVALRINASLVFLSLCLGYVLVQFVANDADSFVNFIAPNRDSVTASSMRLFLLFAPAAMTILITLFSMKGRVKPVMNVLPAIGATALVMLFVVPQLPSPIMHTVQDSQFWGHFTKVQAAFITGGAVFSMLVLWSQRQSLHGDAHGKHHGK